MSDFLDRLAARRRFGMRPSLDAIRGVCAALGDPQKELRAIHVAGTNGKGAVCAMIEACLRSGGLRACRYTSPHLVRINERFFVDGKPVDDATLERAADKVFHADSDTNSQLTFFEALTAVAFIAFSEAKCDYAVLETGLGGRLDATNICVPEICVITKIGLDHCDWLGDTVEKIAAEKAGIIKKGVPIVLGKNEPEVIAVVKARASEVGAPFFYAPDMADESEIPDGFSLEGAFNRENAVTALAALKLLKKGGRGGFRGLGASSLTGPITHRQLVPLPPHSVNTHLSRGLSPRSSLVFAATKMSTRRCGFLLPLLGKESLSARTIHARSPRRNLRERWNPRGFRQFRAILSI